ncbi:MAG TPA: CTP synthase, partial [Bdellovibrionota bacterium]|nr:CTP synthase [Bdellovibrionota bacterium]
CLNLHLTYVPYLKAAGEVKTKPTQHSVQALREIGIIPDMILCRCENPLSEELKAKISMFCHVPQEAVIDEKDVAHSIYEVPLDLHRQKIDTMICKLLKLDCKKPDLSQWEKTLQTIISPKETVVIGIVGKYMEHQDAYKSVFESLHHGAIASSLHLEIRRFESDRIIENGSVERAISGCDGYLVPGGFGERGWEGKILAAKYCRTQLIPFFGLCLGVQVMIVEFARHVLGLEKAHSTEVDPNTPDPVISMLSEQRKIENKGGTMRLGSYPCEITPNTLAHKAYGKTLIHERHRHRYEFNNQYKEAFEAKGMIFSGRLAKGELLEIAEIANHPWMLGVQFHPEFKSRPLDPHPLFRDFIQAILINKKTANPMMYAANRRN